jgi:hypothetical protein
MLVIAVAYERHTTRDALVPPELFRRRTPGKHHKKPHICISVKLAAAVLLVSFLHYVAFSIGTFYLALYYQVR